jgi:hypothetical protein
MCRRLHDEYQIPIVAMTVDEYFESRAEALRLGRASSRSASPLPSPSGVHYPVDVLAGAFIGVSVAELTGRLLDR